MPLFKKQRNDDTLDNQELEEILKILERSAILLKDLIGSTSAESPGGIQDETESIVSEIISNEKRVDRLKEAFIENLYVKKRYLPTFQKVDNLMIINQLDEIQDEIEIVARYYQVYLYHFPVSLEKDIISFTKESTDVVLRLIEAVRFIYLNFEEAQLACKRVEDERREARESQWTLLKNLYGLDVEVKELLLIRSLIRAILKVVETCEVFSDDLHGLTIKYMVLE